MPPTWSSFCFTTVTKANDTSAAETAAHNSKRERDREQPTPTVLLRVRRRSMRVVRVDVRLVIGAAGLRRGRDPIVAVLPIDVALGGFVLPPILGISRVEVAAVLPLPASPSRFVLLRRCVGSLSSILTPLLRGELALYGDLRAGTWSGPRTTTMGLRRSTRFLRLRRPTR